MSGALDGDKEKKEDDISETTRRMFSYLLAIMTSIFIVTITVLRYIFEKCNRLDGCTAGKRTQQGFEHIFPICLAAITLLLPELSALIVNPEGALGGEMNGVCVILCTTVLVLWVVVRLVYEHIYIPYSKEEKEDECKVCDAKWLPSADDDSDSDGNDDHRGGHQGTRHKYTINEKRHTSSKHNTQNNFSMATADPVAVHEDVETETERNTNQPNERTALLGIQQ